MKSIFIASFFISVLSNAEITLHPAPIYKEVGKASIATLNAGVETQASAARPDGYAQVYFTIDAPDATWDLKANSSLKVKGVEFGKITSDFKADSRDVPDHGQESFFAYIKNSDLDPNTIPERALEKKLGGRSAFSRKSLNSYLEHFHFKASNLDSQFDCQEIYTNLGSGLATEPRLYLIFQKEKLAGVIHLNDLKLTGGTTEYLKRAYQMHWFLKNKKEKNQFIKNFNNIVGSAG